MVCPTWSGSLGVWRAGLAVTPDPRRVQDQWGRTERRMIDPDRAHPQRGGVEDLSEGRRRETGYRRRPALGHAVLPDEEGRRRARLDVPRNGWGLWGPAGRHCREV